eukprot:354526-Chlamydomonas_euryale.AAC.1
MQGRQVPGSGCLGGLQEAFKVEQVCARSMQRPTWQQLELKIACLEAAVRGPVAEHCLEAAVRGPVAEHG